MWIRCGWVLHRRLSAGRIQARRTRAVFEREPVALQLGDSQVGRSLRVEVAYVRQLESPWTPHRRTVAPPCRREAYDGRSIDPLSRPSYIPCANRGRSGSQLEDGSAWGGSMELTRRCLLRWGIMLGGGAALT